MTNSKWQTLLQSALETEDYEIVCEECFELLDCYAELLIAQENPEQLMPAVKQHLNQCNCCTRELEALMIMLEEIVAND